MKQTAVEWIIEQLTAIGHLKVPQGSNAVTSIIEEAKEMEKEQRLKMSGYDLNDLATKEYPIGEAWNDEQSLIRKLAFKKGFQKALELLTFNPNQNATETN